MIKNSIQFRNVWRWLTDQASHPKTLFDRKSWGVFSEYAHIRRSDRLPKKTSETRIKAQKTADFMSKKYGGSYSIYKCVYCDGWHVAKDASGEVAKADVTVNPIYDVSSTVDLGMLQKLEIPDFAAVYGGVRGRTLSSLLHA